MKKQALTADLPSRWGAGQRLKNTLIYAALRVTVWCVRACPFAVARAFGVLLGHLAATLDFPDRRRAVHNLARAMPDLSAHDRRRISRQMFVHLAIAGVEMAHSERFLSGPDRLRFSDTDRELFRAALEEGHGVMAVAGHLGNWELLAQLIAVEGYPVTSIAKPLYDPRLTRWVNYHRTRWGHRILWRGDWGVPKHLLRVFRDGGVLGMLIDQDTRVQGEFVPFFGRLAHTPTAPASLALRKGAVVLVGRTWREGRTHRFEFDRMTMPTEGDHDAQVRELTAQLNSWLETAIRKHPEQWVWLHDRWKKQPPLDLRRAARS